MKLHGQNERIFLHELKVKVEIFIGKRLKFDVKWR
jgi:hypothetical protein